MPKKPLVCTIDYDTKDGTNWKASVLAYSVKEAIDFIREKVRTVARINTTEAGREIDTFETKVLKDYFTEEVVEEIEIEVPVEVEVPVEIIKEVYIEKEIEVPVEVIKEVYVEVEREDDGTIKCPWCKKAFKSDTNLKKHCINFHSNLKKHCIKFHIKD